MGQNESLIPIPPPAPKPKKSPPEDTSTQPTTAPTMEVKPKEKRPEGTTSSNFTPDGKCTSINDTGPPGTSSKTVTKPSASEDLRTVKAVNAKIRDGIKLTREEREALSRDLARRRKLFNASGRVAVPKSAPKSRVTKQSRPSIPPEVKKQSLPSIPPEVKKQSLPSIPSEVKKQSLPSIPSEVIEQPPEQSIPVNAIEKTSEGVNPAKRKRPTFRELCEGNEYVCPTNVKKANTATDIETNDSQSLAIIPPKSIEQPLESKKGAVDASSGGVNPATSIMQKNSRHGSWKYIPIEDEPVHYPKITKDKNDNDGIDEKEKTKKNRVARELGRLAMDVVGSQHGLAKPPLTWYNGSDFDTSKPLSMADRIKSNKRIPQSNQAREKEIKEEKKEKLPNARKKGKNSVIVKDEAEWTNSSETVSSVNTAIDSDAVHTARSKSTESVISNDSVDSKHLGIVIPPNTTYVFTPIRPIPNEMPEDILEGEEEDEDDEESESGVKVNVNAWLGKKTLPADEDLTSLDRLFNEYDALYFGRLLFIDPITINTNMDELVQEQESEDMWVVPIRRPTLEKNGHVAMVFRTHEVAMEQLERCKNIVEGECITVVYQPGAFLVQYEEQSNMTEKEFRDYIESTLSDCNILYIQMHHQGAIVVLSSIEKASEFLREGFAGNLTITTLNNEDSKDLKINWPIVDKKWAVELGIKMSSEEDSF